MEFYSPQYLMECFELLDKQGSDLKICAGMTHIARFYSRFPEELSDRFKGVLHVGNLTALSECREEAGGYSIGSMTLISSLESDPYVARYAPALIDAAHMT